MSQLAPGADGPAGSTRWSATAPATGIASCTPCVRLYTETLLVNVGDSLTPEEEERVLPVLSLSFDYGGFRIRGNDRREVVGPNSLARDREAERRARHILESFGPLELAFLEDVSARPGTRADYVVRLDADVHALCSFSAYALPQLRSFGWQVEVADQYPYQIVQTDTPWYAQVDPDDSNGSTDWFSLELGIEVDGKRINLLPALLDLVERLPSSARLDRLAPVGARFFALPVADNRYLTVPPERLRLIMKVLHELYQPDEDGGMRFPAVKAPTLAELDDAFAGEETNLRWSGETAVRERGHALVGTRPKVTTPPKGLNASLRPYQVEGLSWLQHLREHGANGILADDMGLGKTLQAISHIVAEKEGGRLDRPVLVIAPTSLVGNWRRELGKFAPYLKVLVLHGPGRRPLYYKIDHADVVITTYPVLVRDEERLAERRFHLVMLDEAQAIKNHRSQAHKAVTKIDARHKVCLSGTPVENSLSELWAMFEFLMPGFLGDAESFGQRYARPIEKEGNEDRLAQLRSLVAPFILRRTKEEVAKDLPPKTEIVRPVELKGAQRDLYESLRVAVHAEVRRAIEQKGLGASTITILDALMKLRQVCCDPRLLPNGTAHGVRESAKYETLIELVTQQRKAGRKILVFSQFATMLALIGQGLRDLRVPFTILTGATVDRQKAVDTFQSGKADVFLISLKAGGTGLNLTAADTVIHYDPWWNPAAQAQATDRAYRIGQNRPVFVHNLIVAGSVEERMLSLQRRKKALADGLLAKRDAGAAALSASEVEGLFAPMTSSDDEA